MSSPEVIHPKITSIQNHLDMIDKYIREGDYLPALREMYLCCLEMRPKDRPLELMDKTQKEIRQLSLAIPGEQRRIYKKNEWLYIHYFAELQSVLWTSRYFENSKYGDSRDLKDLRKEAGDEEEPNNEE